MYNALWLLTSHSFLIPLHAFQPHPTLLATVADSCLLVLFWYLCSLTRAVCINPALELSIGAGVGVWGASVYIQLKAHFLTLAISNSRSTVRDRAPWPPPPSLLGCCWAHFFFYRSHAVICSCWEVMIACPEDSILQPLFLLMAHISPPHSAMFPELMDGMKTKTLETIFKWFSDHETISLIIRLKISYLG